MPENRLTWVNFVLSLGFVLSASCYHVTRFGGHNAVKFVVLGEVILKGQDHISKDDQARARTGIVDMGLLLG
jgi:hypothetical protein